MTYQVTAERDGIPFVELFMRKESARRAEKTLKANGFQNIKTVILEVAR